MVLTEEGAVRSGFAFSVVLAIGPVATAVAAPSGAAQAGAPTAGAQDLAMQCRAELSAFAGRADLPFDLAMEARAAAARLPALPPRFDGPGEAFSSSDIAHASQELQTPPAARDQDPRAGLAETVERCRTVLRRGLPASGITARPSARD